MMCCKIRMAQCCSSPRVMPSGFPSVASSVPSGRLPGATILRGEWGYRGNVLTDWWMRKAVSPEFPNVRNNAYRVRAQVDVLMPGGENFSTKKYVFDEQLLESLGKNEGLTRAELQRTAKNVLNFILLRMKA